jgi:Anti-sigma-K factor rskA
VAEEPARSEILAHLNRECEACTAGIQRARELVALLGGTAARVGVEPRRFGWAPFLAAALAMALFAAVYFSGRERDLANELARVREQNRQQNMELTRVNQAFAILTSADTTVTNFGEGPTKLKGKVFLSPSQGVLLIAGGLQPTPPGKAYEMWIVKDGKAKAAGMFQSAADGGAMHIERGTMANTDAVAVTLENEAGADQPTSTPLFAAPIRALVQ